MVKTGLQKSQKYPGIFAYLQYQKLGIIFFPFMTKTRTAKNLHFSILHMCLAKYAELFRHIKASLLRIWTQHVIPLAHWSAHVLSFNTQVSASSSNLIFEVKITFFLAKKKYFFHSVVAHHWTGGQKGAKLPMCKAACFQNIKKKKLIVFFSIWQSDCWIVKLTQ